MIERFRPARSILIKTTNTMESAIERLNTLIAKGLSGIVANFDDGTVVTWIHPLATIFARQEMGDSYRECDYVGEADQFLSRFSGRVIGHDVPEPGVPETDYLAECQWSLLWHMVHDWDYSDDPTFDVEFDYDRFRNHPLLGSETLEDDLNAFFQFAVNQREFTIATAENKLEPFYVDTFENDDPEDGFVRSYSLNRVVPEPYVDDETGESFTIHRYVPILQTDSLAVLYAKSRAYFANN